MPEPVKPDDVEKWIREHMKVAGDKVRFELRKVGKIEK